MFRNTPDNYPSLCPRSLYPLPFPLLDSIEFHCIPLIGRTKVASVLFQVFRLLRTKSHGLFVQVFPTHCLSDQKLVCRSVLGKNIKLTYFLVSYLIVQAIKLYADQLRERSSMLCFVKGFQSVISMSSWTILHKHASIQLNSEGFQFVISISFSFDHSSSISYSEVLTGHAFRSFLMLHFRRLLNSFHTSTFIS